MPVAVGGRTASSREEWRRMMVGNLINQTIVKNRPSIDNCLCIEASLQMQSPFCQDTVGRRGENNAGVG